ncbi:UNVERIFIED_CONTAM: hypothetical protein Sindi_0151900 [Sesamum indicum]
MQTLTRVSSKLTLVKSRKSARLYPLLLTEAILDRSAGADVDGVSRSPELEGLSFVRVSPEENTRYCMLIRPFHLSVKVEMFKHVIKKIIRAAMILLHARASFAAMVLCQSTDDF